MCIYNRRRLLEAAKVADESPEGLRGYKSLYVKSLKLTSSVWYPSILTSVMETVFEVPQPSRWPWRGRYDPEKPAGFHFCLDAGPSRLVQDPTHALLGEKRREVPVTVWARLLGPVACGPGPGGPGGRLKSITDCGVQVAVTSYIVEPKCCDMLKAVVEAIMQPQAEDCRRMLKDAYTTHWR